MKYRDFSAMNRANDGSRSLLESIVAPEVKLALADWFKGGGGGILIGGLGLSYYVRPRATQDVDVLYLSDADIPAAVQGFKRSRGHAFTHKRTHVEIEIEIEIVTAEHVNVPTNVIAKVIETAQDSDGMRIASPAGMVASKLFRGSMQDKADIVALIKSQGVRDLSAFPLPQKQAELFAELVKAAEDDPHPA